MYPFKEIPVEAKTGILIPHIKLIVFKLSGELTRPKWLDREDVTLTKYQIVGSNIDQPIEDTSG